MALGELRQAWRELEEVVGGRRRYTCRRYCTLRYSWPMYALGPWKLCSNIIGIGLIANKVQTALLVQIQNFLATAFPDKQFDVKALISAGCTIVKRTVRWTLVAGKSLRWKQTNWSVYLSIIVRVLSGTFAGINAISLSQAWARAHHKLYWLKQGWNDDFSPA